MPREIVSHTRPVHRLIDGVEAWLQQYYVRGNYTSGRAAVYEQTGQRNRDDYTYRVKSVEQDFRYALKLANRKRFEGVVLLGVPIVLDYTTEWRKKHDDENFCSSRSGIESEPGWCHCVHADYSRVGDFLFSATKPAEDFEMQLGVAISLLEVMRFYNDNVPEVKDLSMRIFNMPQVSDSMQKYIACIVLDKDYIPEELKIMVQTTIVRNRKWNADDLSSTAALLILLPLVKQLFHVTAPGCRLSEVSRIHDEYKVKLASFDLHAKYHASTADLPNDRWTEVRKAKAGARTINPQWISTVCGLAVNFGVSQTLVDAFRQDLQQDNMSAAGRLVVRFKLPTEEVFWIRDTSAEMRLVKVDQGVRAVGLSVHSKCHLMLSPDSRAVIKAYRLNLNPQCEGGGTFSVSADNDRQTQRQMLTSRSVSIEFDLRSNMCVIRQERTEFTLRCNRLHVQFSGGILTMTPTLSRKNKNARDATATAEVCGICLEDTKPSDIKHITDCNHTFHKPCIDQWITHCSSTLPFPTCPMCRARI